MPHVLLNLAADGLGAIIVQVVGQLLEYVLAMEQELPPTNWMAALAARMQLFWGAS